MYDTEEFFAEEFFLDHDTAVSKAMAVADKGLFDTENEKDEDLQALYDH